MSRTTYIAQGEQAIHRSPDAIISTILGSCVSACLWDPKAALGGMNHILLPAGGAADFGLRSAGAHAMEDLINALLKAGAEKGRLRAKVFGGASIVAGLSDIGARNAEFVLGYLATEAIPCDGHSTGGALARQIRFWPATGQVRQRFVRPEAAEEPKLTGAAPQRNGMELF